MADEELIVELEWLGAPRSWPYKGEIKQGDTLELPQKEAERLIAEGLAQRKRKSKAKNED